MSRILSSARGRLAVTGLLAAAAFAGANAAAATASSSDTGLQAAKATAASDQAAVARSIGDFGADFYRVVRNGNSVVSPFSLEYALAGLYVGAGGSTQSELGHVLHNSLPIARFVGGLGSLNKATNAEDGGDGTAGGDFPELSSANALWADLSMTPKPAYADQVRSYGADLRQVDFQGAPSAALQAINQWADDQTHGRITNVFSAGQISSATRLVVANAVYFKGRWDTEFQPRLTRSQPFHRVHAASVSVRMMHMTHPESYAQTSRWQAVELPYRGGTDSMLVIVPRNGIGSIESQLSGKFLASINKRLSPAEVTLSLPKFEMRGDYNLIAALKRLGAQRTTGPRPDLTGIFENSMPGDLTFGAGVRKTFMHVDEQGTEAAAVTAETIEATGEPVYPRKVTITANHPFLAVVQDGTTGAPLFFARVMDPSKD